MALEMNSHVINQTSRDIIVSSIPWNPVAFPSGFKIGDWINSKARGHLAPLSGESSPKLGKSH
jgi:hypothetical protein